MQKMTITVVRTHLIECRLKRLKWREIEKLYPGVKMGTLCRIAKDPTYDPKDNTIRHALGLQQHYIEVAPLPCGHAPAGKRCAVCQPKRTRQPDPVIRVKKLKRIIDGAPLSPEMKRELLELFGVKP